MSIIDDSEHISDFADLGIIAFTTTRQVGTFGMMGPEPVSEVMGRWAALRRELYEISPRLATGGQVHGNHVLAHDGYWDGWLRGGEADGHFASKPRTALAVTVADGAPSNRREFLRNASPPADRVQHSRPTPERGKRVAHDGFLARAE